MKEYLSLKGSIRKSIAFLAVFILGYFVSKYQVFGNSPLNLNFLGQGPVAISKLAMAQDVQSLNPNLFVSLAKKLMPSVVNISTLTKFKGKLSPHRSGPKNQDELFRKFFDDFFKQGRPGARPQGNPDEEDSVRSPSSMSLGTGFIIDDSGLILTNNHVIEGADEIKINFTEDESEKPTQAEIVGRDPELDLALIRVMVKKSLIPAKLGDSDKVEVGEYVAAIGNPFGQGHSITHGIISAKGRPAPDFILGGNYLQTDAPINPGNSGGPLVNLKGEVIAINNAIDQRAQGIGFAIPINLAKKVLSQLKDKGSVTRGYIGVLINELTPEIAKQMGVSKELKAPFLAHVYPGEPADRAGLKPYDVVVSFNGKQIHSANQFITEVTNTVVGDKIKIKVLRKNKEMIFDVVISKRPSQDKDEKSQKSDSKKMENPKVNFGMTIEDLDQEILADLGANLQTKGVYVSGVTFGGFADKAGVLRGDIIVEVNQKKITSQEQFIKEVSHSGEYLLKLLRVDPQGREGFVVLVLKI